MASKYGSTKLITVSASVSASAPAETSEDAAPSATNSDMQHVHLEFGGLRVRNVGQTVNIPNNIYLKTNFFIKQSRKYFEDDKLCCFVYFRGMQWAYLVMACLSIFAATSSVYAFLWLIVNATFMVIWTQHMLVVFTTLPLVLRQHMLSGTNTSSSYNQHFNVLRQHCSADILESNGEGCGILRTKAASYEFQSFSPAAVSIMKSCRLISIISFTVCFTLLIYCCASGILITLKGHY